MVSLYRAVSEGIYDSPKLGVRVRKCDNLRQTRQQCEVSIKGSSRRSPRYGVLKLIAHFRFKGTDCKGMTRSGSHSAIAGRQATGICSMAYSTRG